MRYILNDYPNYLKTYIPTSTYAYRYVSSSKLIFCILEDIFDYAQNMQINPKYCKELIFMIFCEHPLAFFDYMEYNIWHSKMNLNQKHAKPKGVV